MENSFIELIPAASASESTSKSSALFKEYLASFFKHNALLDTYSQSRTVRNLLPHGDMKRPPKANSLDGHITVLSTIISDRGLLFQQTRERGVLFCASGRATTGSNSFRQLHNRDSMRTIQRSHRHFALNRNGAILDALRASGSAQENFRQNTLKLIRDQLNADAPLGWRKLSAAQRDQLFSVLDDTVAFCSQRRHKLSQLYVPCSLERVYPDPHRLKAALHKLARATAPLPPQFRGSRICLRKFYPILQDELRSSWRIRNSYILYEGQHVPIRAFISQCLPTPTDLNFQQLELLVCRIFPRYISEETINAALHAERIQPGQLSIELSETQYTQFNLCKASSASLIMQWRSAFQVLEKLQTTFHQDITGLIAKAAQGGRNPSGSSIYSKFSPLEQLIIDLRYQSILKSDAFFDDILLHPDRLGKPEWHSWRPMRRYVSLVKELAVLMKDKGVDPFSDEGIAQIDALLILTGFYRHIRKKPGSFKRCAEPLLTSEKLLINRLFANAAQCVVYSIADCLCFDPTLFAPIQCPGNSNSIDVPAFEKACAWVNDSRTALSGLKKLEISPAVYNRYRNLFERPDTSRKAMADLLQPLCNAFDWESIHFPPLAFYQNKPAQLNNMRLLLIEYALLRKLIDETRNNLLDESELLIDQALQLALQQAL